MEKVLDEHKLVYIDEKDKRVVQHKKYFLYKFTEEEKDQVREELRRLPVLLPPEVVQEFLAELEGLCHQLKGVLILPKDSYYRTLYKNLLTHCKNLSRELANFKDLTPPHWKVYGYAKEDRETIADWEQTYFFHIGSRADAMLEPLKNLTEKLEEALLKTERLRVKRKQTDSTESVKSIAKSYRRIIGEPSAYRLGPFANIVRVALDAVNLPSDDPIRPIRNAIKSLRNKQI